MNIEEWIGVLTGLLGVVFLLLIGVLAWIGARVHSKLDNLYEVLGAMDKKLGVIEKDLRSDIIGIDMRLTVVETESRVQDRRSANNIK